MSGDTLDYVGVRSCGCVVSWLSATHMKRPEIAKEVAHWIREGLEVQRMTTDESRKRLVDCPHRTRPSKQEVLL